ncbi:MAG: MXAN_6577-like cysteine-rich protein [Polyangiales bacterium]
MRSSLTPLLLALTAAALGCSSPTAVSTAVDAAVPAKTDVLAGDVAAPEDLPAAEDAPVALDAPAADSATGGDAAQDVVAPCPSGQERCDARCVDLQNDPSACGSCAMACQSGESCVAGTCVTRCPAGQIACAGRCVDTQTDRANCGACGTACPTGEVCSMGACTLECAAPTALCGGDGGPRACANLQTDRSNCGACGSACGMGELCEAGVCRLTCPTGQTPCGGVCVSTVSDPANCGACGTACTGGQQCVGGTCTTVCEPGITDCGQGRCRNIQTDPANCGACGRECPTPTGGVATCALGSCGIACSNGFGDCDLNSTNGCETRLDSATNCGACGRTCAFANAAGVCRDGACALGTCNTGFLDCDGNPANGCEVNARTDRINCGRCGAACGSTQSCVDGVCGTSCSAGSQLCGGACTNLQNDPSNCGACGTACRAASNQTPVCAAGRCDGVCLSGFGDCDNNATNGCETNVQTSVANCGRCGTRCALTNATAACSAGACAIGSCSTGFGNCDNNATNGCETNLQTSNAHCGACGRACAGTCTAGTCVTTAPRTFSQPFSNSSTVLTAACTAWRSFRASLTATGYTSITVSGSASSTVRTCTNPAAIQQIVTGLRNLTQFHVSCDGHVWSMCNRYEGEFWIDAPSLCSGSNCPNPGVMIRPCFNSTNNYNGVGTATCNAPAQTITINVR